MRLPFCDICNNPIEKEAHILFIIKESNMNEVKAKLDKLFVSKVANSRIDLDKLELCETCTGIIYTIFRKRKQGVKEVLTKINNMYNTDKYFKDEGEEDETDR